MQNDTTTTGVTIPKCPIEQEFKRIIKQQDSKKVPSSINNLMKNLIKNKAKPEEIGKLMLLTSDLSENTIPSIYISDAFNYLIAETISMPEVTTEAMKCFLKKKIMPCERSFGKVLEFLVKMEKLTLLKEIIQEFIKGEFYGKFRLTDCMKALTERNKYEFILDNFATQIPLDCINNTVWEDLIEKCTLKEENFELLKTHLTTFFTQQHPNYLNVITARVQQLLQCMLKHKFKNDRVSEIIAFAAKLKLRLQGNVIRDSLIYFLNSGLNFQKILAVIQIIKYTLDAFSFTQLISQMVELDLKFEIFCLIELSLNDQTLCFTFNDLSFSSAELQYIIIHQSYFNQMLSQLREQKPKVDVMDMSFNSQQSDQESYIWECLSIASTPVNQNYEKILISTKQ